MLSRRILLAISTALALVLVSGASGEPINGYTASGGPPDVKPSTQTSYTIALTNGTLSPGAADRAKIGIPTDFVVAEANVQPPSTSAAGDCVASTWVADGTLVADGKINLKRPNLGGGANSRLCPGATLTVVFSATSAAADGTYIWATELLRGEDAFVLSGSQPTVRVDGTPPAVTISSHPANPSNVTSPSFGFSANEPTSFQCKLDSGPFAACTSPKGYDNLADGSHTFTVKATDAAGNTGQASYSWLLETNLPIVTLTEAPSQASKSSAATFSFTASKPASFECRLDGGAFAACTSPESYSNLADGSHTFTVKATDTAGNVGPETTHTWTIDTVPPVVTITQKPSDPSNDASPTFGFSASEAAGFQCKLDGASFTSCTSPKSYTPGNDAHTLTVRATDAAGNTGEATYAWIIDTVAPTATITQKPNNPSNVKSPTFAFSASESASFQCKLDGDNFAACSSPKTYNLADGAHAFTVKATDAAGNTGEADYSWLLETNLPIVMLTQRPTDPTKSSSATFAFEASKVNATLWCSLDGESFAECLSLKTYSNLSDGSHTFAVKAVDSAGNPGPATIYTWTIDTVGPTAAINQKPGDPTNSRSASFEFAASETTATFQCKLDDAAFASCATPQAFGNLADGRHTFVVRASDALSNLGPETVYAWTIETRAPAVAVTSGPAALASSTSASFSFSADEPSTFQCNLDDRGFEPCSSPASYAGLPDGGHAFAVRATDAAGNVGAASASWTIDATAPQTTIDSAPALRTTATSAAFTFSANESATFQCRLDGGSFSPCGAPSSYARLASGVHRFAVRAIDAAGNVDATPAGSEWTVAGVTRTVATSALFAPAAGARVTRPPLLRWRPVRGAAYYNVQLYRAGRKVLTAWPTQARLQLRARWRFNGRVQRLAPGVYRWFVWPGHGQVTARRYGKVLGASTFVVRRAGPRR